MDEFVNGLVAAYRGVVQGVFYGTKIRLPHAAVMTLLFQEGTLAAKARSIAWLSFQHARNLAAFVGVYKTGLAVLRLMDNEGAKSGAFGTAARPLHALVAGAAGGWLVWANYSSVNFQIVMYLMSRVAITLVRLAAQKELLGPRLSSLDFSTVYPYLAASTWGLVLFLYEFHPHLLHPSLESSMAVLYRESNVWPNFKSFLPSPAAAAVAAYLIATLYSSDTPLSTLFDFKRTKPL